MWTWGIGLGGSRVATWVSLVLATSAAAQDVTNQTGLPSADSRPYSPYADRAFPTQVYFGDTHVHTALSADAGGGGTRLLPRDAYRFARGEQITSNTGQPVKLARPFDFYMITDHSDGMGAIVDIIGGAPNIMAEPLGREFNRDFNAGGETALRAAQRLVATFAQGKPRERVYDVAWSDRRTAGAGGRLPPVGNTVDLSIPSWTNPIGAAELSAVWKDPEFDPTLGTFYYARVIEIPTPRWTAYDAVKFKLDLPDDVTVITQERAYTSPIWYTPGPRRPR